MVDTLFQRIISGEIPADFIYQDALCVAINDANPQAPVHVLIIPRKPLPRMVDAEPDDQALLGHLLLVANQVATQLGVQDAFRLVVNNGATAGQSVFHLHLHLLAGRALAWPPG